MATVETMTTCVIVVPLGQQRLLSALNVSLISIKFFLDTDHFGALAGRGLIFIVFWALAGWGSICIDFLLNSD